MYCSKKLGSGSFGEIFLASHVTTGEASSFFADTPRTAQRLNERRRAQEVAVKMEPVRTQHPQLLYEAKVETRPAGTGLRAAFRRCDVPRPTRRRRR